MSKLVSTTFKLQEDGKAQALIYETDDGWLIEYYDPRGSLISSEQSWDGRPLQWAVDAAENWAAGIKVLNG